MKNQKTKVKPKKTTKSKAIEKPDPKSDKKKVVGKRGVSKPNADKEEDIKVYDIEESLVSNKPMLKSKSSLSIHPDALNDDNSLYEQYFRHELGDNSPLEQQSPKQGHIKFLTDL